MNEDEKRLTILILQIIGAVALTLLVLDLQRVSGPKSAPSEVQSLGIGVGCFLLAARLRQKWFDEYVVEE